MPPEELTVCVLDRPRHAEIIASLRSVGCRIYLITDGDVAGVMNTADPSTGVDLYVGQGGAPEGVLACAALKCVGGQFQGRLVFRNADDKVFALLDRCPHKGGPLSQGIVFGESVACPLHNWTIGLDDGCAKAPDAGCVQRFSVRVDDGAVALDLLELAHPASDLAPACRTGIR